MNRKDILQDEGIDAFNLLKVIINNYVKILVFSFIIFLFPALYIITTEINFKAKLEIDQTSSSILSEFDAINLLLKNDDIELDLITKQILYDEFIYEFLKYEILSEEIKKFIPSSDLENTSEKELNAIAQRRAKNFQVFQTDIRFRKDYIQFYTKDKEAYETILNKSVARINNLLFENIKYRINKKIDLVIKENSLEATKLQRELDIRKKAYAVELERDISFLEEQSEIARSIGIIQPWFSKKESEVTINDNFPFYLRGYSAISKEVELKKNRDSNRFEIYDEKYDMILQEFNKVITDPTHEILEQALSEIEKIDNFEAISIDTDLIEYRPTTNKISYLIISVFASLFIVTIFFLFFDAYKKRIS